MKLGESEAGFILSNKGVVKNEERVKGTFKIMLILMFIKFLFISFLLFFFLKKEGGNRVVIIVEGVRIYVFIVLLWLISIEGTMFLWGVVFLFRDIDL